MATFIKMKQTGLPKASAKLAKLISLPKVKATKIKLPNLSKSKTPSSFNFSKFTKTAKLPKSKKVTLLKKAIKKNVGF